jgi:DNA-binding transcriptional LysR family regulator
MSHDEITIRDVMDIRQLRTFDAVVQHGSFTAAASALGYTQSAVSQHVAALEGSLGVTLFERRPFALTPAARRLAEHAGNILLRLDVAASEMRSVDRRPTTTVVATPFAAVAGEVAGLLSGGGTDGGGFAELSIASLGDTVAQLARGGCSAGLVDGIVGRSDPLATADPGLLTALLVRVAPLSVMLPADHPFADGQHVAWSSLVDARWLDAPQLVPHMGPGAIQLLERRWGRTRFNGTDPSALSVLVGGGHGLALVPSWWTTGAGDVRIVPLSQPALVHRIELLVLRPHADRWARVVRRVTDDAA